MQLLYHVFLCFFLVYRVDGFLPVIWRQKEKKKKSCRKKEVATRLEAMHVGCSCDRTCYSASYARYLWLVVLVLFENYHSKCVCRWIVCWPRGRGRGDGMHVACGCVKVAAGWKLEKLSKWKKNLMVYHKWTWLLNFYYLTFYNRILGLRKI